MKLNEETNKGFYTIRSISISDRGSEWRTVHQYHFTSWANNQSPKYFDEYLEFVEQVQRCHAMQPLHGPIAVHCRYNYCNHDRTC